MGVTTRRPTSDVRRLEEKCLNCGATLAGPFCGSCGQRAIPPYPTVQELASDAFNELSGWDGRFATTIRTLIRRPGELTREFLTGRRARYISPIRLYLVASITYFLAAAASPNVQSAPGVAEVGGFRIGVFTPQPATPPGRVAENARAAQTEQFTPEERQAALADVARAPAVIRPILRRAIDDPQGLQRSILTTMPRALFALLPVFAGILALFYRKRNYPEHLYFALHLHAFVFLALTVSELTKITQVTPLIVTVQILVIVTIAIYATLAMRGAYGGSVLRTLAKEVGIGGLYAIAATPIMVAMLAWAAIRG
jgi:hypothetical protein